MDKEDKKLLRKTYQQILRETKNEKHAEFLRRRIKELKKNK